MTSIALPSKADIERLSRLTPGYPANIKELIWSAREYGFGEEMVDFLMQFASNRIFQSEDEFINAVLDLELLEGEENNMPKERLRSPQD